MPQSRDELGKFLSEIDPMEALLVDPATIDGIGIEATAEYLIESFDAIAEVRFPGGSKKSKPYEDFIAALDEIERWAMEGCVVLWPCHGGGWVQRVVELAARDRLESAKRAWRGRAGGSAEKGASPDSSTATEPRSHQERLQAIQNSYERAPDFYKPLGATPGQYYAWKRHDRKRCSHTMKVRIQTAADKLPLEGPFKSPPGPTQK
jgi:hypothetical protein